MANSFSLHVNVDQQPVYLLLAGSLLLPVDMLHAVVMLKPMHMLYGQVVRACEIFEFA